MENINFGEILLSILFLAIVGHILYEIFFKKKFITYAPGDFSQTRIANNMPEHASDEENEEVEGILEEVFKSWTVVEVTDDNEYRQPLKAKQVKGSTELINKAIGLCPTGEYAVERLNEITNVINLANKRVFTGSKTLVIVALVVFALISYASGTWSAAFFFIGSIVFYILASFTPAFIINRKEAKGNGGKRSFMTALIGGIFGTIASAKTVKYVDPNGKVVDTDNSETWMAMIFTFFMMVIISSLIAVIGLISYLRNFWLYI